MGSANGLLAEIEAEVSRPGSKCRMKQVLTDLSPDEGEAVREAVRQRVEFAAISRWLRKPPRSMFIPGQTISRHFRGQCSCGDRV